MIGFLGAAFASFVVAAVAAAAVWAFIELGKMLAPSAGEVWGEIKAEFDDIKARGPFTWAREHLVKVAMAFVFMVVFTVLMLLLSL
jgi:hypothetical protein